MSFISAEIASQPQTWLRAAEVAAATTALPARGERVAVIGCGTSLYMAKAFAACAKARAWGRPTRSRRRSPAAVEQFVARRQFTFLGSGWTVGLADEGAQAWTASYVDPENAPSLTVTGARGQKRCVLDLRSDEVLRQYRASGGKRFQEVSVYGCCKLMTSVNCWFDRALAPLTSSSSLARSPTSRRGS